MPCWSIDKHGSQQGYALGYLIVRDHPKTTCHSYHLLCSIQVASVVQMTHMLLCHGGILASKSMSIVQHLSSYWSAAVHDYEHGGLNNDFLIKTAHPLALLYK